MRTVELSWEDEDWFETCFKLPCLLWECRRGATVRQARETDGLFVFSCLCSPSRTTLILTLAAEDVCNVSRKTHIALGEMQK